MTLMDSQSPKPSSDTLFRASKRRKVYRQRESEEEPDTLFNLSTPSNPQENQVTEPNTEELGTDIANILKLRRIGKSRRGGIEFSNSLRPKENASDGSHEVDQRDETLEDVAIMVNRFAPQTGQVADVDEHMVAYIDSQIAKQRLGQNQEPLSNAEVRAVAKEILESGNGYDTALHRQPAALGKLQEIDLGPDAKERNIKQTEAATAGSEEIQPTQMTGRGRHRKRRTSEDIRRDKLVEEVLRESRLGIYDETVEEMPGDDSQAADDRIAEQFRREFMDAVSSRRQRTGPIPPTTSVKGAKPDDRPKGPKLGGSRSARAAMKLIEEKAKPPTKR